jgi:hypothetical protein
MPDVEHPTCGAKMQRVYKRENSASYLAAGHAVIAVCLKKTKGRVEACASLEICQQNANVGFLVLWNKKRDQRVSVK